MNMLKNLFAAFVVVMSLTMIACQGDASDAREQARESLATNPDGTVQPVSGDASQQPTGISTSPSGATPAGSGDAAVPSGPTTTVQFEQTDYDFGSVKDGEKVKHKYKFKNTGSEPLIISSAKGSCGCTVPKWPSEPIPPGGSGEIDVEFDSKGKPGKQTKRVTVTANTVPAQIFLNISGNVEKDPNAPAQTQTATQIKK